MDTKSTSVKIPEDLLQDVVRVADREERSLSSLIRMALKEYIKNHENNSSN